MYDPGEQVESVIEIPDVLTNKVAIILFDGLAQIILELAAKQPGLDLTNAINIAERTSKMARMAAEDKQ